MQRIVDISERLFVVLLAIPFVVAFVKVLPTHPNAILVCISEMLGVFLIVIRRSAPLRMGSVAVLAAFLGTAFPLLVRPGGLQLVPTLVSSALMFSGLALSIASKLYLNRSFGLIAANRGVKTRGPYRFVRHPMYLGYIVNQFGFLLSSFSVVTLGIYLAAWTIQIVRVREEESVLCADPDYRDFSARVPTRLIPGLY
jgi:protein-S-isoprenylcysteine O-methyltransferase Ste14